MAYLQDLPSDIRARRKRRGPRMNSRVPLTIAWNGKGPRRFEAGFTRVVNGYGCLLVSPAEIDVTERLRITNLFTRQEAEGVVVWKGAQRPDGWDLGVEFVASRLDFWGIEL
ncbi:MAG: hypothetical protein ACRD5R_16725 [Candidatus Acidiferrales bacterium]